MSGSESACKGGEEITYTLRNDIKKIWSSG